MSSLVAVAASFAALAVASPLASSSTAAGTTEYLFVFGDSYTSDSFSITGTKPSVSNPMGNSGMTFSGGLTWPGFLTTQLNTSTTLCYDFAVAGATVDNSIVAAYATSIPDIVTQVQTWATNLQSKPSYAPWTPETALFAVWIGVNDVGNSYTNSNGEDAKLDKDMDQLFAALTTLYTGGARNFALLNVPPTDKTPQMMNVPGIANLRADIDYWNAGVVSRAATFRTANVDANVTIVDTRASFNEAIADPQAYGAPDATCTNANGKSCLWYNTYHPGTAIQKLVAEAVAAAYNGTFF